ncbi:hypothetical protein [Actinosynnema sp.]
MGSGFPRSAGTGASRRAPDAAKAQVVNLVEALTWAFVLLSG